jgi:hypothetical protein
MCMPLDRRLQILLDEPRYRRLEAAARARKTSVATIVREAIDLALPADLERKREAARRILEAEPVDMPETIEDFKAELEEIRGSRFP